MVFLHNYNKESETTITRYVGPTDDPNGRPLSDLNTSNYTYIAPINGNDANDGTSPAQAIKTLDRFRALLSAPGTRRTGHIIRNGGNGNLELEIDSFDEYPDSILQVELGEICYIYSPTGAGSYQMNDSTVNGIDFLQTNNIETSGILQDGSGSNKIVNCRIYAFSSIEESDSDLEIEYSLSIGISMLRNVTLIANNCIFLNFLETFGTGALRVSEPNSVASSDSIAFTRCTFINFTYLIISIGGTVVDTQLITLDGCDFVNIEYLLGIENDSTDRYIKITTDYCHGAFASGLTNIVTAGSGTTVTDINQNNSIDPTLPSLFTNQNSVIVNADPQGARLQFDGKKAPNGFFYYFSSPLIDAYDTGGGLEDVNPWDENTVILEEGYTERFELHFNPSDLLIRFNLIGRVEIADKNGNIHVDYDDIRKQYNFNFSSYANNQNIWRFVNLMMDNGSIRFYPLSEYQSLFPDSNTGLFDDSNNSFLIQAPSTPLVPRHWKGYWITINKIDYYIIDNDSTKLYLIDKTFSGFPANGIHVFGIYYILIKSKMDGIEAFQEGFSRFLCGGAWREIGPTQTDQFEYTGLNTSFSEVEDIEINTNMINNNG